MSFQYFLNQPHVQGHPSDNGYICPTYLLNVENRPDCSTTTYDIGNLKPGYRHELPYNLLPTPQSIIDGTYTAALEKSRCYQDIVLVVPRLPKYLDEPSLPGITFSYDGRPGPYITDLVQAKVKLDQASDLVFLDQGWRRTSLTIDWPCKQLYTTYISCVDGDGQHRMRQDVARFVSLNMLALAEDEKHGRPCKWGQQVIKEPQIQRWDLKKVDCRTIRLMAINYYRVTWVAVLAVDDPFIPA